MVRLKGQDPKLLEVLMTSFNSNMVRLKVSSYCVGRPLKVFQFQYGTIKRPSRYTANKPFRSFNSNMVRLKDNTPEAQMQRFAGFNSNMVRLKAPKFKEDIIKNLFQFQYGTIKSLKDYIFHSNH